jgi:hypothetical protein
LPKLSAWLPCPWALLNIKIKMAAIIITGRILVASNSQVLPPLDCGSLTTLKIVRLGGSGLLASHLAGYPLTVICLIWPLLAWLTTWEKGTFFKVDGWLKAE